MLKTSLKLILVLMLLAIPICAQEHRPCVRDADGREFNCTKPFGKWFAISSATYWAATFADINSSRGPNKYERNPLLKGKDGHISTGKALAFSGGIYAFSVLLERRKPKLASLLRFVGGGVHFVAAAHNYRL